VNLFDINGGEFLIIVVLALVLIGPERLPHYAAQLARLAKRLKSLASDAKEKVSEELGPELGDVDWSKFDPRQYDPRRIVRDALADVGPILPTVGATKSPDVISDLAAKAAAPGVAGRATGLAAQSAPAPAPFDPEAT
jgi:sec-independent protein translocase protein TatB